jgi:Cu-Zn family superoxide dismutase
MNIIYKTSLIIMSAASLMACSSESPQATRHTANFINNDGDIIGRVDLTETPSGITASIEIDGLTPGQHGMHFHKVGDCSDSGFKNSGGHINPGGKQHGLSNSHGPDNADLPNLVIDAESGARQTVTNDRLSFDGKGKRPALFDADGSAMVIHASADDQMSQPIGGAGPRVACAVIKRD